MTRLAHSAPPVEVDLVQLPSASRWRRAFSMISVAVDGGKIGKMSSWSRKPF